MHLLRAVERDLHLPDRQFVEQRRLVRIQQIAVGDQRSAVPPEIQRPEPFGEPPDLPETQQRFAAKPRHAENMPRLEPLRKPDQLFFRFAVHVDSGAVGLEAVRAREIAAPRRRDRQQQHAFTQVRQPPLHAQHVAQPVVLAGIDHRLGGDQLQRDARIVAPELIPGAQFRELFAERLRQRQKGVGQRIVEQPPAPFRPEQMVVSRPEHESASAVRRRHLSAPQAFAAQVSKAHSRLPPVTPSSSLSDTSPEAAGGSTNVAS